MTKILLIMEAVLFTALVIVFFLWMIEANKAKKFLEELKTERVRLDATLKTVEQLENTIDILKKNKEVADEKIDALHNGDSISNALDELRKSKG